MRENLKKYVSVVSVIGFAVFVIYLTLFSNFGSIIHVVGKTSIAIYALAFVCVFCGAAFDALTWHQILHQLSVKTTYRRVFGLSWVGIFVDAIVPSGWSGDVFKAYMLSKDRGVDGSKTAASIVVKKVFELIVTLAALVLGLVLLVFNYTFESEIVLVVGIMMALVTLPIVFIIYLSLSARKSQFVFRAIRRFSTLIKGKKADTPDLENRLKKSIAEFHEGVMMLKTNSRKMFKPMAFQVVSWVFSILTLFLIFASIGYIISPEKIIITNSITVNLQTQGFALAGFLPILSTVLYRMLGTAAMVSVASSLLATFPTFWFRVIVSFVIFQVVVFDRAIPFLSVPTVVSANSEGSLLNFSEKASEQATT